MKGKVLEDIRKSKEIIFVFVFITIFTLILINVLNSNILKFDVSIYNIIIKMKSNLATNIFKFITEFGSAKILILITIICLILIRDKRISVNIAINLASIALLNHLLKISIQRPRPPLEFRMVEESSFSFPSGHSMSGLAFYGLIIYFIFKNVKNKNIRNIMCIFLAVLSLLIGISRIYLGVHYASDVLGGFVFAIAYLILYVKFILKK